MVQCTCFVALQMKCDCGFSTINLKRLEQHARTCRTQQAFNSLLQADQLLVGAHDKGVMQGFEELWAEHQNYKDAGKCAPLVPSDEPTPMSKTLWLWKRSAETVIEEEKIRKNPNLIKKRRNICTNREDRHHFRPDLRPSKERKIYHEED